MQNLKDNRFKEYLLAALIGTAVVASPIACSERSSSKSDSLEGRTESKKEQTFSFSEFGKIQLGCNNYPVFVCTADLDGDGDQDIIAGYAGRIMVFENKIPQKNKIK